MLAPAVRSAAGINVTHSSMTSLSRAAWAALAPAAPSWIERRMATGSSSSTGSDTIMLDVWFPKSSRLVTAGHRHRRHQRLIGRRSRASR